MDNVGSTFETSVRCLRPFGAVVTIAGGDPTNVRSDMGSTLLPFSNFMHCNVCITLALIIAIC